MKEDEKMKRYAFDVEVSADTHAKVETLRRKISEELGHPPTDDEFLSLVLERFLKGRKRHLCPQCASRQKSDRS